MRIALSDNSAFADLSRPEVNIPDRAIIRPFLSFTANPFVGYGYASAC
jgi:hypothetical protein